MRIRALGLATMAASLLLLSKTASAQTTPFKEGFALQQFEPAPAGDRFFGVADGAVAGSGKGYFNLIGNFALKPLRLRNTQTDSDIATLTSTQLYLHLDASLVLWNRLLVNADIPFAIAQSGDTTTTNGVALNTPTGGKLADLRLGLRLGLVGTYKDPFSLAIGGDIWLPTGDKDNLTSDGKLRGSPKLTASGISKPFVYSFNVGALFRKHEDLGTPEIGTAITFGAAAGVLLADDKVQIGPELYGNTVVASENPNSNDNNVKAFGAHSTPLELLFGAKLRLGDVVLGAGAGPGLSKAPGTPQLRALLSVGLIPRIDETPPDRDKDGINDPVDACPDVPGVPNSDPAKNGCPPPPPPPDRDNDGIPDEKDACPDVPGVANDDPTKNGCPPDRDGDGIPDAQDACPDVPGVANSDPAKNGCPADKDGDGIPDAQDACIDVPGVKSDDPKKNGCPPDKDGDGIVDAQDACIDVPGVADPDPKKNGCPKAAEIKGREISLNEQVQFDTGKATIRPASDALLQTIAGILKDHPEIELASIEGHTDNVGNKGANKLLSKNRAAAVVTWLVKNGGIDKKRLKSEGLGQEKPIADNTTDEGRQKNRRVEIKILKLKEEKGGAAPAPKPAPAPAPKKK